MRDFYVSVRIIKRVNKEEYYVQYWWNTDLRTDSFTDTFPVEKILLWLKGN